MPTGQRAAVDRRFTAGWRRLTGNFYPLGRRPAVRSVKLAPMLTERLYESGLRGWQLHVSSLASVWLCVGLWIRAKTIGEDERGNAERRALFVGLWPPMLWLMGDSIERQEVRRLKGWARTGLFRRASARIPRL